MVYAVAHEGSRLDIPEGPLGMLIAGTLSQNVLLFKHLRQMVLDAHFLLALTADCWAEPHQRPSCEDILSRLQDCEYTLC